MIELLILTVVVVAALVGVIFLLGFRLGGEHWQSELTKLRLQAAQRQLHDLTRQAFVSMAEEVQRRRHE